METTTEQKKRRVTGVSTITTDITKPLTMKLDAMEFNKLTLLTGMNGTGKSFLFANTYLFTEIGVLVAAGIPREHLKATAQFILEKCFDDVDTTGTISVAFDVDDVKAGCSVTLVMENGKINDVTYSGFENIVDVSRVKYMSAGMRTFDAIKMYLSMRKMIKQTKLDIDTQEGLVGELLNTYKLYDVTYLERLINAMPLKSDHRMKDFLTKFDDKQQMGLEDIEEFGVDLDKPDFFLIQKGEKKYLTTFGKGHQSIFNMLLGSLT